MRQKRKVEHIVWAMELEDYGLTGFDDLHLIPSTAPELSLEQVDCSCSFLGKTLSAPIIINAMTGGHPNVYKLNAGLAEASSIAGIAMAVGSQRAGLEKPEVEYTYKVAREKNRDGVILANINAGCKLEEAMSCVEMVQADGIQLYLNVAQELSMSEGDVDYRGIMDNISLLLEELPVPVIVKEVGFGMSWETVSSLAAVGVKYIDIGGKGGTNFAAIEAARQGKDNMPLVDWGIPTVPSMLEALTITGPQIVVSGGVRTCGDIAKSLAAGAIMAGIAKPFLKVLMEKSVEGLVDYISELKTGLCHYMMAMGARNISEMRSKQMVVSGNTAQWLKSRGIDADFYARR